MTTYGKMRPNDLKLSVRKATNTRFSVAVWELEHGHARPDPQRRTIYYQITARCAELVYFQRVRHHTLDPKRQIYPADRNASGD